MHECVRLAEYRYMSMRCIGFGILLDTSVIYNCFTCCVYPQG